MMEKILTQLSENYNDNFNEYIFNFRNSADNKDYDVFYPSFGMNNYRNCDFLFYGQSIKGWQPSLTDYSHKQPGKFISACIDYSNNYINDHSPLDWVNIYWSKKSYLKHVNTREEKAFYGHLDYLTSRSFFWNVVYKLVNAYEGIKDDDSFEWSKKIVWSNLYKIAPSRKANPNEEECNWQWPKAAELVRLELEEIQPKFCVVLTNYSWWKDFAEAFNFLDQKQSKRGLIETIQQYGQTKIIVTKRPFVGSSDQFVKELIKEIGSR